MTRQKENNETDYDYSIDLAKEEKGEKKRNKRRRKLIF